MVLSHAAQGVPPVASLSSRFCVTVFPALPVATFGPDTWMVFGGRDAVRTPRLYEAEDVTLFAYVLSWILP